MAVINRVAHYLYFTENTQPTVQMLCKYEALLSDTFISVKLNAVLLDQGSTVQNGMSTSEGVIALVSRYLPGLYHYNNYSTVDGLATRLAEIINS